jgi:hypothetical protein
MSKRATYVAALAFTLVLLAGCAEGSPRHPATSNPPTGTAPESPVRDVALSGSQFQCPVTLPNDSVPPGEKPSSDDFGNGDLWTLLWPNGTVIFEPGGPGEQGDDLSLSMKWPWWRGVAGSLEVDGTRLDAPGILGASIPEGYGGIGFQATALIFSEPGCWKVTAHVGDRSLTFITAVELKPAVASNQPFELPTRVCIDDSSSRNR